MNREEIQKLIREEIESSKTKDQFNVAKIPFHVHNNLDAPQLKFIGLGDTPSSFSGQAGKVAVVNSTETALRFSTGSTAPASPDTSIQFNNSGDFGGDDDFTWNSSTKVLTVSNGSQNSHLLIKGYVSGSPQIVSDKPLIITAVSQLFIGGSTATDVNTGDGSALATTAIAGFFYPPQCAGIPTGVPTNGNGALIYDTTNNDLYVYNTAWKKVHLA